VPDWLSPTVRARFVRRYVPSRKVVPADTEPYRDWWDAQNESALAADGPLWVAFGDSIAQSIGASTPDRGYVGLLLARLRAADGRPWRVLNVSFSGARLGDVRRKQMRAAGASLHTAEVVTCGIGVNDLIHSGFRHAPGRIRAVTRELPSHAVISTVPHGFSLGRTVAYNAIVRREARRAGLRVADVWAHTSRPYTGKLCVDHFHPSDAGHADWCAAFADALGLPPT
jgi:lysophospholipase L1-like esterase